MGDWSWDGGGGVLDPGSLIITFLGCRALRNLLVQHFLTVLPRDLGVGGGGLLPPPSSTGAPLLCSALQTWFKRGKSSRASLLPCSQAWQVFMGMGQ